MPSNCVVPGCSRGGSFRFPSDESTCLKWRLALRREDANGSLWKPSTHSVVCDQHFKPEDFRVVKQSLVDVGGKANRRLKREAVPSLFSWSQADNDKFVKKHRLMNTGFEYEIKMREEDSEIMDPSKYLDVLVEEVKTESINVDILNQSQEEDQTDPLNTSYVQTICTKEEPQFSIENFVKDPSSISYYTGLSDYNHFKHMFSSLGPSVEYLNYQNESLTRQDEFFLTLMKLRQNKDDLVLGIMFQIHRTSVEKVFKTWVNFMFYQIKDKDLFLPYDFKKKFPNTKMTLDTVEIKIKKPSKVEAQKSTWNSKKKCYTIKTMVGISPNGVVSFISSAYDGCCSDRQIIERSGLLKLKSSGDAVIAHSGVMVKDLIGNQDVKVNNTPTPMSGVDQLPEPTGIASKGIYVEKVVALSKTYKILQGELDFDKIPTAEQIVYVCLACCNFRENIVPQCE
uniref:Putative LOC100636811 [Amphimedon queenslandica] n=1 Tax=Lepeophtheirus salmonis TaxID=72036 RepID=A0A0K2UX11_LEPSM